MLSSPQLTGNKRHRQNWRGRLILQVEESKLYTDDSNMVWRGLVSPNDGKRYIGYWRDAKIEDLTEIIKTAEVVK